MRRYMSAVAAPLIAAEVSLLWARWISGRQKTFLPRIFYELGRDLVPSFSRITFWPVAAE